MRSVGVRSLHRLLRTAYAALAGVAMVRLSDICVAIVAGGLALVAYLAGRVAPDMCLSPERAGWVAGLGALMIVASLFADLYGGTAALTWSAIVLAYGTGNRWKAGGVGTARAG